MSESLQKFLANRSLNKQAYEVLIVTDCNNCGTEVPESADSCPGCGHEVGRGDASLRHVESHVNPGYKLLSAITGGLSVLLLGALVYVAAINATPLVSWSNFIAWFLLGHGALLALKYFANLMLPAPVRGKHAYLIGGGLTAATGALCLAGFGDYFVPIAIVSIAVYILSMAILKFYSGNRATTWM